MKRRVDLDAARGLMLVLMALTHLPTRFSGPAGQPFGFVSAAEGFVMLSAYMAGMVYTSRALKDGIPAMRTAFLLRALKIYGCQAALLLFLFTFIAVLGLTFDRDEVKGLMGFFLQEPLTAFIGSLLLLYNPPLLDILPIYIVFMLVSPLLLAHGVSRGWFAVLGGSLLLWLLAQFDLGDRLYAAGIALSGLTTVPPKAYGSFEIFGWQFLWVLGLWMGSSAAQKPDAERRFPRAVVLLALVYALTAFVWRQAVGQVPFGDNGALNLLFDKWHVGPLRLFNFFALLVLAMHYGPRLLDRLPRLTWLEVMGSASLPVFCAHLVLVLLALVQFGAPKPDRPFAVDVLIVIGSFAALYAVALISQRLDRYAAAVKERWSRRQRRRRSRPNANAMR
ncbi:MAG: OpgC domain-containing protein [Methylibium sp.]|uniref:OpgC domain-containing protein n=1 Tax=Methylibium sp. TaxID=2067992 RepID=UPI0017ECFCA9|nr:OpgC domain-containing protein [Methylibium sp.]MBA3598307.1 OpgC domain-containing protein [Methylibium sp.]